MGFLSKILGKEVLDVAERAGGIWERISKEHLGKKEAILEVQKMHHEIAVLQETALTTEINAKTKVMVAELQHGDAYTKRARPTIVYAGLVGMFAQGIAVIDFTMPIQFWGIWGGVCGIYAFSRSQEKKGTNGQAKILSILS